MTSTEIRIAAEAARIAHVTLDWLAGMFTEEEALALIEEILWG